MLKSHSSVDARLVSACSPMVPSPRAAESHRTLFLCIVLTLTTASPIHTPNRSFTITQARTKSHSRSGPAAVARTYHRHNVPLPPGLASALLRQTTHPRSPSATTTTTTTPTTSGQIAASPLAYDEAYICTVRIGTPPQPVPLDFDSNSADLWVAGSAVGNRSGQPSYDRRRSSTAARMAGYAWNITYVGGSGASGSVYRDVVDVGGVLVAAQAVEVADEEADWFLAQSEYSGFVGLGFGSDNRVTPERQATFFENVRGRLDLPVWTADLRYHARKLSRFPLVVAEE